MTLIFFCVLSILSCTQFEDIGSDLVDDDQLVIDTDTALNYEIHTYRRDSLFAYVREGQESDFVPSTHILGQINDPVFGYSRYDLTAQVQFSQLGIDFTNATFDSAFLLLSYDTTFAPYGETNQMQTLDVYELQSREFPELIYTTDQFETKPGSIGSLTYMPSLIDQNRGDSLNAPSHIRIPMTAEFGQKILSLDTSITSSVLNFLDEFPGFVVRPRQGSFEGAYRFYAYATQTSGQSANTEVSDFSGIRIYYTKDGESEEAYLRMSSVLHHFTTVEHQITGSELEKGLEDQSVDPEYLFIQPTSVGIRIDFNDLSGYQGKVINDASLIWTVAGHDLDDTTTYKPMESVFALEKDKPSLRKPITDILFNQSGGAYRQFFGGLLEESTAENDPSRVYTFNITNEFQRIVNGSTDPVMYIVPTPQDISRIARSVIYGPGIDDVDLQPKIRITYSSTNN